MFTSSERTLKIGPKLISAGSFIIQICVFRVTLGKLDVNGYSQSNSSLLMNVVNIIKTR